MPEDLIVLQFLEVFSVFGNRRDWSYSWSIPVAIAFVLSVALELWLFRKRKKKENFWIIVGGGPGDNFLRIRLSGHTGF